MEDINRKVNNATKWSSITEIASRLIAPVTNAILARLLVPEAFGAVATINMVISFAEIFSDAGFQKFIIQNNFKDDDELNKSTNVAFWTNIVISAILWFIIFFFRHSIARLVGDGSLGNGIAVASVAMLMVSFSSIQAARFRRSFDFKSLFGARIIVALIPLFITVPLAYFLRNYWALIGGTLCSQGAYAIFLTIKSKWRPSFFYSFTLFKKMISFTLWTLFETISIWLTNYIGTFIVGTILNSYYLGLFKTSMSTVNAYMNIVATAFTPVLFSALSRLQNNQIEFNGMYLKFQRIVSLIIFPMGLGLFIFRNLATDILLGSNWSEAADFIGLWSLTSSITIVFSNFNSEVFRSKGKPRISLYTQLLHLAVLVPVLYFSASHSFHALYIARSLVRFQIILVSWIFLYRETKISPLTVLKNVFPFAFATICMGGFALVGRSLTTGIFGQFVVIFLSVILYFTICMLIPATRQEMLYFKPIKRVFERIHNNAHKLK